jgi:hypothetical protein
MRKYRGIAGTVTEKSNLFAALRAASNVAVFGI